jgi:polyphosphate kinase
VSTAHEQCENYLRRFLPHLPGPGEMVLLDRSRYDRAGVEHVLDFCQPDDYDQFLRDAPEFEQKLTDDGIALIKLWFSVTRAEQLRRMINRQLDPVKRWKLSPVDLASLDRWDDYTRAEEVMFRHTDLSYAPWTVINGNDKRRARLEVMRYVLSRFTSSELYGTGRRKTARRVISSLSLGGDKRRYASRQPSRSTCQAGPANGLSTAVRWGR